MKKIMKLALSAGAIAGAAIPALSVVSCGGSDADITIAMRAEDLGEWDKIMSSFEEKTGISVGVRLVSDQKADYATWAGTDSLPEIALLDQNTAKDAIIENKWFQPIKLNDIKNAKYDVVNEVGKEFDFADETNYAASKVLPGFYTKSDKESVIGIPYGYGSQGIYFNKNNLDFSKPLKAFVPKNDGTFGEVVVSEHPTMDTVRDFIFNSGVTGNNDKSSTEEHGLKLKDADIKTQISQIDSNLVWYDNGPFAMYQRLGSIGKSLGQKDKAGWIKDVGLPFELTASLGGGIFNGTLLNDDKLEEFFPNGEHAKSSDAEFKKLYQSYFGYFINDKTTAYASNPKAEGQPGEADALWDGKGNIMLGYKWQSGMIRDNWYKKASSLKTEKYDDAISIVAAPYGSIGVDALGITKGVSGEKLDNVKKFLRYAFEQKVTKNAYNATMQKTLSPVVAALMAQKNDIKTNDKLSENEKARQEEFFNSSEGTEYEKVSGGIMAASTKGIYDIYNGQYGGDEGLKSALSNRPTNYKTWKSKFDTILPKVGAEIAIKS